MYMTLSDAQSKILLSICAMEDTVLPPCLDSEEKQMSKARELAKRHLGVEAISACRTEVQGCFSRTLEVSMEDSRTVIIQLRVERLDTAPFLLARSILED